MIDTIVSALNKEQQEAVETIDGPVMVLAGPGTGKTQVLAARIAYILKKTDTPPYGILALTFTESAAANMRERVVNMIGKDGYYVNISTFHSFCKDVISSYPEYFSIDRRSEPLGELEKYELFQQLIDEAGLDILKPINSTYFYINEIISSISQLKREGFLPDDFEKVLDVEFADSNIPEKKTAQLKFIKQRDKNKELLIIYRAYQKRLNEIQRYDFDDMISLVGEAFKKNENLLRNYQERLLYFLVDEYQDTNSAQNSVVELLGNYWGEKANIFVVGDPHQSIFRFQGASIENTLEFLQKFPQAKTVQLQTVYRCPQIIADAAMNVISNNTLTQPPKLESIHKDGEKINVVHVPSHTHELFYIAESIKKLIEGGTAPEEIAILYRRNSEAKDIQHVLEKWSINYEIDGGQDILNSEVIQQLLRFVQLISDLRFNKEDETIFEVLSYSWIPLDKVLVMKTGRAAGKAKLSMFSLIQSGYETFMKYHQTTEVTPIEFHQLEDFMKKLVTWAHDDARMPFTEWFEHILKESGFFEWLMAQENKTELLTNLNSLYREIKAMTASNHRLKLPDFVQAIATMQEHKLAIFAEDLNINKGVVHLSTVHRAKGREWEHVFLIHCYDGNWGNVRTYDLIPLPESLTPYTDLAQKEQNEDERRLFYVAITRAKKTVRITYPQTVISANRSRPVVPSMFLFELGDDTTEKIEAQQTQEESLEELQRLLQPKAPLINISDKDFFKRLVKDFRLSSTALNTYLRDVNEFVENSLLRIPRAKPAPMAFGTAIHSALEYAYNGKNEKGAFNIEEILKSFEEALQKEIFTDLEYKDRLKKGQKMLKEYCQEYEKDSPDIVYVERMFGYGFGKAMLGDISLTGRIDRIDWIDKATKTVRVVDYKTGKSKSTNEIEGKTVSAHLSERELSLPESIRGPYKRQLLFYKLLTELDKSFVPTVTEGVFDFIEPHKDSGKFSRQLFILQDEDVTTLKELIKEVMHEIRELKFLED